MGTYHQMGHNSENLLAEVDLCLYAGAILSPVNYPEGKILDQIGEYSSEDFEMIFDPQLYYPNSTRGELPSWSYFPTDVDTVDQSSRSWWRNLVRNLSDAAQRLDPGAVCSPAIIPRRYTDEVYQMQTEFAAELQEKLGPKGIDIIQTVLVDLADLSNAERPAEIASIVSGGPVARAFMVATCDVDPRRELSETEDLKGMMRLVRYLEEAGMRVIVGFSSSEIVLWKFAGAASCATGKFFNLRRFTPSRWDTPAEGGGQLPYWFEESMMAYLRESDLIRVRDEGFLSEASLANPYGQMILKQLDDDPERAWVGLSWRQYLYWFADFERRFDSGELPAKDLLREAERTWGTLDDRDILMEERQNDGSWLRPWRRAILEAF